MIEFNPVDRCLICSTNNPKRLFAFLSKDNNRYEALQCRECGLVYASPQPILTHEAINEIYSSDYYANYYGPNQDYQEKNKTAHLLKCYEKEYQVYKEYVEKREKLRMFDVGCGDGKFLEIFRNHGWECLGLEPSENARRIAIEKGFNVIDLPFLEIGDSLGRFDLILMDNVIEHVNQPNLFLSRAFELLNPGGVYVCKTPNSNALNEKLETSMLRTLPASLSNGIMHFLKKHFNQGSGQVHRYGNLHPPVHLEIFNKKSITTALMKAGFHKEKIFTFTASPYHPKWTVKEKKTGFFNNTRKLLDRLGDLLDKGEYLFTIAKKD